MIFSRSVQLQLRSLLLLTERAEVGTSSDSAARRGCECSTALCFPTTSTQTGRSRASTYCRYRISSPLTAAYEQPPTVLQSRDSL